jgi:hypothetical protein
MWTNGFAILHLLKIIYNLSLAGICLLSSGQGGVGTVDCPSSDFKKGCHEFFLDELFKDMLFLLHGLLEERFEILIYGEGD